MFLTSLISCQIKLCIIFSAQSQVVNNCLFPWISLEPILNMFFSSFSLRSWTVWFFSSTLKLKLTRHRHMQCKIPMTMQQPFTKAFFFSHHHFLFCEVNIFEKWTVPWLGLLMYSSAIYWMKSVAVQHKTSTSRVDKIAFTECRV